MGVIQRIKLSWKGAIRSEKIIKLAGVSDVPVRSVICFADEHLGVVKSDEKWYGFQQEEKAFRFSLSGKQRTSENFICRGDFHLWNKVIRILTSVFLNGEGSFSYSRPNSRGPCNLVPRAIMSFSCRTQPPVMTLVPTYTFVGNLFQAFVMYARVGLRGSRRFGLVLTGTSMLGQKHRPVALKLLRWLDLELV